MTNLLTLAEQKAVTALKAEYDQLSGPAKAALAQSVSWAERHIWSALIIALIAGVGLGAVLVGA